jgi:hypothetical protein
MTIKTYNSFLASILLIFLQALSSSAQDKEPLMTNAVYMHNAPKWLKVTRVEKVTDKIQSQLEWSTRRIHVYWHNTQESFQKQHSLGPLPRAVAIKSEKSQVIHLGPKITNENFDWIFGHELVHIIIYQKYKEAIPKWLEEGLANHLAKKTKKIDYKWLASKPFPKDVTQMNHPFAEGDDAALYHYTASQALAEMLEKKCDLENLIRLSVERKMENYIVTYCEIKDLNKAFQDWVLKMAKRN